MNKRHPVRICVVAALLSLTMLSAVPARAGLFGESDEEKAARLHEKSQDDALADLTTRIHDLEEALRQSTGQNEQLSHRVQELSDKLERQRRDFEYRLCTISAQQLGASQNESEDQTSLPCPGGASQTSTYNAAPPPAQQQQAAGAPVRLAPAPGVLGTLPAGRAAAAAAPQGNPQTRAQFDTGLDLLSKARYDEARAAFRGFVDANPGDELAPQAVYWIGDIAFVQKDYANAARSFLEELKKYPTSTRAPDSMLKLGQSLIAMGQAKEGCSTLGALSGKYPNASKTVLSQAASERKASCH
jgi:tol-pal system protein YbgF